MECPHCGTQIPAGSNFCPQCGQRLPLSESSGDTTKVIPIRSDSPAQELSDEDHEAVSALPSGHALLIVERGPDTGARYLLDTEVVTAGRHPDSDIFLDDITVSRHHGEFVRTADGWIFSDKGSLNGSYVNGSPIDPTAALRPGDEVQIGKYRMVFFVSEHGLN